MATDTDELEGPLTEAAHAVAEFWNLLILLRVVPKDAVCPPEARMILVRAFQNYYEKGAQSREQSMLELQVQLDNARHEIAQLKISDAQKDGIIQQLRITCRKLRDEREELSRQSHGP